MIGVAQVIGMKPTLRSFFSSGPPCAKASVAAPSGRNCEMAASAVEAPTACRKARRVASCGKSARMTAPSTTRVSRASLSAGTARSCSAWLPCAPQEQPRRRRRERASKPSSKVDMGCLPLLSLAGKVCASQAPRIAGGSLVVASLALAQRAKNGRPVPPI